MPEQYDGSQASNLESQTNAATEQAKSEQEQRNSQTQQQLAAKRQQSQQPQKGGGQQKTLIQSVAKDASNVAKVMGSFKKGGIVPKTGAYKLHEGEQVIPKDKVQGRNSDYRRAFLSRQAAGKHKWGSK